MPRAQNPGTAPKGGGRGRAPRTGARRGLGSRGGAPWWPEDTDPQRRGPPGRGCPGAERPVLRHEERGAVAHLTEGEAQLLWSPKGGGRVGSPQQAAR